MRPLARIQGGLVCLGLFIGSFGADPLVAQYPGLQMSEGAHLYVWVERPDSKPDPYDFKYYADDAWIEGTLVLGGQYPLTNKIQIVSDLPVAFVRGDTNGCVDAYCDTPISGFVLGNPLVGLRYSAFPGRLWIQVAYRFPIMDLDPWEPGVNTWQRMVNTMAMSAALTASDVSRRDAIMPHTRSVMVDASGSAGLTEGIEAKIRVGAIWIEQDSSRAYQIGFVHNTAFEVRYQVALQRQIGEGILGVGVLGRKELAWSPDWVCLDSGSSCRRPIEVGMLGAYRVRGFTPSLQLRLPVTEARTNEVNWVLGFGLGFSWGTG